MLLVPDKPYHVELVALLRFNLQGKIAQLKGFYGSGHIQNTLKEHEEEIKQTWQAE